MPRLGPVGLRATPAPPQTPINVCVSLLRHLSKTPGMLEMLQPDPERAVSGAGAAQTNAASVCVWGGGGGGLNSRHVHAPHNQRRRKEILPGGEIDQMY